MFYTHERNFGCRLNDELTYRGLRVLVLENELVRVSVLLDQGTDIYEFLHKPSDTDFMWRSPNGVRKPGAVMVTSAMLGTFRTNLATRTEANNFLSPTR